MHFCSHLAFLVFSKMLLRFNHVVVYIHILSYHTVLYCGFIPNFSFSVYAHTHVCVCVYICMCVCMCIHMHTYICMCMYIYMYICVYMCLYMYIAHLFELLHLVYTSVLKWIPHDLIPWECVLKWISITL